MQPAKSVIQFINQINIIKAGKSPKFAVDLLEREITGKYESVPVQEVERL